MDTRVFCTIVTSDYIHYALALRDSLLEFNTGIHFYILITDNDKHLKNRIETSNRQTYIISPTDICKYGTGRSIYTKYAHTFIDGFRWSMKPILLQYLLKQNTYNKVIYLDCDLHFYSDFNFLFDLLNRFDVILSPHNRSKDPGIDPENFQKNFTEGLYNGGFIGVNKNSIHILEWWANACLFKCEVDFLRGYYVDQKYLDLIPARFKNVYSLDHLGCNVAEWNKTDCLRTEMDGAVWIKNKFPIVFIHFTHYTIWNILYGTDTMLMEHLRIYASRLMRYNSNVDLFARYEQLHDQALVAKANESKLTKQSFKFYFSRLQQKLRGAYFGFTES